MASETQQTDTDDPGTARPAPRRSLSWLRLLGRSVAAVGLIAALSLVAREAMVAPKVGPDGRDPPVSLAFVPSSGLAARPVVPLASTGPRYRLDDPDALDPVRVEPARLNPTTGRREDVLIQGSFAGIDAPYLRLTVADGAGPEPIPSLFVIVARRAADGQGLSVTRAGERGRIETKFGPVETLEATLDGAGSRICTGFSSLAASAVRIDGWLCAPLGQPPEARAIVCALDKLTLNGQASPTLDAAFRDFDAKRDPGCRNPVAAAAARDLGAETGSISHRRTRKNEAKLRRSSQARP